MQRTAFCFADLARECEVLVGHRTLDGRALGACVHVPEALRDQYPYNASAYAFLQQLRPAIYEYGLIEFPGLPVNPVNHTLAQRAPWEHLYSVNPYLTDYCQAPHQDTPPYPTAFWLGQPRQFFATWVVSIQGLTEFQTLARQQPDLDIVALHRQLVARTLAEGQGWLINREPGLVLLDNSDACRLYHARTCSFERLEGQEEVPDAPMYAYNEMGLLHYIDQLDSRRGMQHRDPVDQAQVEAFLAAERAG